jgi:hypothetical protein
MNEKVADADGSAFILHPSSFILIFFGAACKPRILEVMLSIHEKTLYGI